MFRAWYLCCKNTEQYKDNESFPIIRQFEIDTRRRFFAHDGKFRLGRYILDGPNGITPFAANYALKLQREQAKQTESSFAAMRKQTEASFSALAQKFSPSSAGVDRNPRHASLNRLSNSSFPSSNRPPAASPGCCARCGRKAHRARDCTESTVAKTGDSIICDFRNGRLYTRAGNVERCFRYNSGLGCSTTAHATEGKHKCTLCGNDNHAAVNCGRAE